MRRCAQCHIFETSGIRTDVVEQLRFRLKRVPERAWSRLHAAVRRDHAHVAALRDDLPAVAARSNSAVDEALVDRGARSGFIDLGPVGRSPGAMGPVAALGDYPFKP